MVAEMEAMCAWVKQCGLLLSKVDLASTTAEFLLVNEKTTLSAYRHQPATGWQVDYMTFSIIERADFSSLK